MFEDFNVKAGDVKKCCVPIPKIKGISRSNGAIDVPYTVTACLRLRQKADSPVIPLDVEISDDGCDWCFVIDATNLEPGCVYDLEFLVEWEEELDGESGGEALSGWSHTFALGATWEDRSIRWRLCGEDIGELPAGNYTLSDLEAHLQSSLPSGYALVVEGSTFTVVGPPCDEGGFSMFTATTVGGVGGVGQLSALAFAPALIEPSATQTFRCHLPEEGYGTVEVQESLKS